MNINSADSSVNIVQEQSPEVFGELLSAVRCSATEQAKRDVLERAVVGMQESFGTPTFGEKYKAFMSVLADHIQVFGPIIAPYLPALASLVT